MEVALLYSSDIQKLLIYNYLYILFDRYPTSPKPAKNLLRIISLDLRLPAVKLNIYCDYT